MNEKQLQDKINGTIWAACDTLRSSIPGGNYKDYALVMLFVKYLSDTYKEEKEKANEMYNGNEQMIERYLSRSKFILKTLYLLVLVPLYTASFLLRTTPIYTFAISSSFI